jgi:NADPH:quinone reductase-like Zn-dependent oxidoreductase
VRTTVVYRTGQPEELINMPDIPGPAVGPGEIRVRVAAIAVNPVAFRTRAGLLRNPDHPFPLILGWDVAGIATETGPGITRFTVGDRVFGALVQLSRGIGTYAEGVVAGIFADAPATSSSRRSPRGAGWIG